MPEQIVVNNEEPRIAIIDNRVKVNLLFFCAYPIINIDIRNPNKYTSISSLLYILFIKQFLF